MKHWAETILQNNPWGPRPSGNGDGGKRPSNNDGENLDDLLRQAQERFRGNFKRGPGRNGGGGSNFQLPSIMAMAGIALLLWIGSGVYRVEPEENAVLLTFGKWTDTKTTAGLGYHMPWPIQEVQKINVAFDRRIEVGFRENNMKSDATSSESMMLTGDENIIDINFVILWRINDAGNYLFKIRDPELTIKKVAESAMREIIGRTPIQKAMTEARGQIETDTRVLMQKVLDEYESGVTVNSVQLLSVNPPAQVVDAFDDVQRARTDAERLKNEAETYRNDIVPRARGEAQKLLADAEAYKKSVTSKAEGEASRFLSVYNAYTQSKDVTEKRLYIETMQHIMSHTKKVILSDEKAAAILPYLPLNNTPAPTTPAKP